MYNRNLLPTYFYLLFLFWIMFFLVLFIPRNSEVSTKKVWTDICQIQSFPGEPIKLDDSYTQYSLPVVKIECKF